MSEDWRGDVNLLLEWVERDRTVLDRVGKRLHEDERAVLEALVKTKGDAKALVEQLGPIAVAKLKARGVALPERARQPAATVWKLVRAPLKAAWRPPSKATPEQLAQAFLDKYKKSLEELGDDARAASRSVAAMAETLRTVGSVKTLIGAASGMEAEVHKLEACASSCTHAGGDRARWVADAGSLAKESLKTLDMLRSLDEHLTEMAKQCDELAASIRTWADAPAEERASLAGSMGARVRAARGALASMQDEFAGAVLGR